jgi:hypothetical protein
MNDGRPLVAWALATFHATFFVLAFVLLLYSRGGFGTTLATLNTLVGLGLFLALWGITLVTTRRALRGVDALDGPVDARRLARQAIRWGAANGVAFLGLLAFPLIVGSVAATPPGGNPLAVLGIAAIASPFAVSVAAVIGGLSGLTLSAIDLALIGLARRFAL